jgi:hypothetical protein
MSDPASSLRRKGRAAALSALKTREERAPRRACGAGAAALPVTARSLAAPART